MRARRGTEAPSHARAKGMVRAVRGAAVGKGRAARAGKAHVILFTALSGFSELWAILSEGRFRVKDDSGLWVKSDFG